MSRVFNASIYKSARQHPRFNTHYSPYIDLPKASHILAGKEKVALRRCHLWLDFLDRDARLGIFSVFVGTECGPDRPGLRYGQGGCYCWFGKFGISLGQLPI
jgi:hypothetical protein